MDKGFDPGTPSDLIKFQIRRNVSCLYKNLLIMLEDVRDGQSFSYERARKRILDLGNETIRELESQIDMFDVNYKR